MVFGFPDHLKLVSHLFCLGLCHELWANSGLALRSQPKWLLSTRATHRLPYLASCFSLSLILSEIPLPTSWFPYC